MKVNYICRHCGSDNLVFDATAEWNVQTQKMDLVDTLDHKPYCINCEESGWAEEVNAEVKVRFFVNGNDEYSNLEEAQVAANAYLEKCGAIVSIEKRVSA